MIPLLAAIESAPELGAAIIVLGLGFALGALFFMPDGKKEAKPYVTTTIKGYGLPKDHRSSSPQVKIVCENCTKAEIAAAREAAGI